MFFSITSCFIFLCLLISLAFVYIVKRKQTYWVRKGVSQINPTFFLGNLSLNRPTDQQYFEYYRFFKQNNKKFGGVYGFTSPQLVPVDNELIKNILIKDFDHFMSHVMTFDHDRDPLSGHLLNLTGEKWKTMRTKLTPTFTSGKMKMMFSTFVECTEGLKDILDDYSKNKEPVNIKEVLGRFTTDIIGSCAFGLQCNTMKEPDSDFRKFGKKAFSPSFTQILKIISASFLPKSIVKLIKFTDDETEKFFMGLVKNIVEYREENNIYRKDFMHLLLQLKNRGTIADDDQIVDKSGQIKSYLTMEEISAQCFVFFLAGFETSSTAMDFALFELAQNYVIQTKLRNEIHKVLAKYDNKLTYDAISDMTYLDQVLREALRKHPPAGAFSRKCNKNYQIPGTNVVIERNTRVIIPVLAIHRDEEFYPEPEKFIPERFSESNKAKIPVCAWLPFGEGPRQCIGLRFGLLQSKVGLITILKDFQISLNDKTKLPLEFVSHAIVRTVKEPIWLNITNIKKL